MGFTAAQAARLTGCTLSQLSSWERSGLVTPPSGPTHRYRYQDLVALRVVASLLDAGLGLARIRTAVGSLVTAADGDVPRSLVTDGETVWPCREEREMLDALRNGPVALVVVVDRIEADVDAAVRAFDAERQAFVQGLHDADSAANGEAESGRAGDANAHARSLPSAMRR